MTYANVFRSIKGDLESAAQELVSLRDEAQANGNHDFARALQQVLDALDTAQDATETAEDQAPTEHATPSQ